MSERLQAMQLRGLGAVLQPRRALRYAGLLEGHDENEHAAPLLSRKESNDPMRPLLAALLAAGILSCSGRREFTQAEQASAEERESYRKKIEKLFLMESLKQWNTFGSDPIVLVHEGRTVLEAAPSRLVPVTPKLPPRKDIVQIKYKSGKDLYWVAETPEEIDRIYQAALRESKEAQRPTTARYFYPDGSSFDAPLEWEVFDYKCGMGLYFYGGDKLLYEISGHPRSFWLELRLSEEGQITNHALNELIQEYCRRSPSYLAEHPDE
jgi:hypothetical protein